MTDRAVRIQRKRTKGFDLQAESVAVNGLPAVSVTRPGKWGNPFVSPKDGTPEECIAKFEERCQDVWVYGKIRRAARDGNELAGKNLACWCPIGSPCHADVLLKIINECVLDSIKEGNTENG